MDQAKIEFLCPLPHLSVSFNQGTECPHGFHTTAEVCTHFKDSRRSYNIATVRQPEAHGLQKMSKYLKLLICTNKQKYTQEIQVATLHVFRKMMCSNSDKVVLDDWLTFFKVSNNDIKHSGCNKAIL